MADVQDRSAVRMEPDLATRQAAFGAIGWLVIAIGLQALAQLRLLFPGPLDSVAALSYGRVRPMADTALIFGWLALVGFCAMFAIVPRAVGAQLHNEVLGAAAATSWHLALMAGLATLAVGANRGRELAELPAGVDIALTALALLVFYDVAMTSVRRNERKLFVSVWYLLAASLIFPLLIVSGNLPYFGGMVDALIGAFYLAGLEFLWLVPVGFGIAYYVVPASTGNPIPSRPLAVLGFWTLLFVGGWTGVRYLVGGPIPEYVQAIGVAMTLVVLIPVLSAGSNILGSARGRWDLVAQPTAVRYAVTAVVALVLWVVLAAASAAPSVSRIVGLSSWHAGLRLLAVVGAASFFGFALLIYVYPLVVGRTWYSWRAASFHYWVTLGATTVLVASNLAAGLVQGSVGMTASRIGDPALLDGVTTSLVVMLRSFHWVELGAWVLLGLAQLVFAWNAARTSRSGEPVQLYYLAAEPAGSLA